MTGSSYVPTAVATVAKALTCYRTVGRPATGIATATLTPRANVEAFCDGAGPHLEDSIMAVFDARSNVIV
jgi:hypothetical protein